MKNFLIFALVLVCIIEVRGQEVTDSLENMIETVTVNPGQAIFGSKQNQRDTPGSGYYLSIQELELFNYTDVNQQLKQIPGVNIQQEDGFGLRPNISLRGVSPERSSKITLMEDGVLIAPAPYSAPSAYYFPTAGRMHAVEVLKGGSQIKYGPQTTGGAINMISTPIPEELRVKVNTSWGTYNTRVAHANAGNTSENFGYLVEAFNYASEGFKDLDNAGDTGFDKMDYMAKFMLKTDDDAKVFQSLLLKLQYSDEISNETYLGLTDADFAITPYRRYAASQVDKITTEHQVYSLTHNIKPAQNIDIVTTGYITKFHRNWYKLADYLNTDGENVSLNSILTDPTTNAEAYNVLTGGNTTTDLLRVKANNRNYDVHGIQTELNWDIKGEQFKHHFSLGGRYHYDQIDRFQWQDEYAMINGVMAMTTPGIKGDAGNRVEESEAIALFAQYDMKWNNLTVSPGLRYESIDQNRKDYDKGDPNRENPSFRENSTKVFLPGLSIQYDVNRNLNVFGGLYKGFAPAGNTPDVEDENSLNYEFGIRTKAKGFTAELISFHSSYDNLLGADLAAIGGGGIGDQYNGGAMKATGIEFLTTYDFLHSSNSKLHLPVMVSYTYTDTEFQNHVDTNTWGEVTPGDQVPYIAEHQIGLISTLKHPKYELSISGKYQSEMRTLAGQGTISEDEKVGAYFTVDLGVQYHLNKNFTLRSSITNLLDNDYEVARSPYG
ncbi:MAG: TonB-dependent receptor family protein, partial [Flavobacteriales bacterium]